MAITPTPPSRSNVMPINPLDHPQDAPVSEVYEDLRVPLTTTKLGGVNDPNFVQLGDDGSGSTGVFAYAFDAAAEEEVFFAVQLPHYWQEGTDIIPHVHWSPSAAGAGNVIWGLEYTWANREGTFPDTDIVTCSDAATGAGKHETDSFAPISGAGKTLSSMLLCRLFRHATDVADTYAADAFLLEIDFHYLVKMTDVESVT